MLKYLFFLLAAFMILNISGAAQTKEKIIAKVGNQKISEREFKVRYELVPHFSRDMLNEDSTKQDLLNSIIAEKLLSLEASRLGIDTTDYFEYSLQQIKDMYVRDALYKKVIDSKVKISENDIQEALNRFSQSLSVKIISDDDSSQIFSYYNQLCKGAPFDSIERISDPIEYDSNKAAVKITYGQMQDDYVEDTLYSLKIGQFSSPVKTKGGWFIFKLVDISTQVPSGAKDLNYNRAVLNILRLRKSRIIGIKYLESFYKNKNATVDSTLFLSLAEKISSILSGKKIKNDYGRGGFLYLTEPDIMNLIKKYGRAAKNEDIVHIDKNPIKLQEYLFSLVVYPIQLKDPSIENVAYNLMENLNKYIQYKFLAEEGFKEGLQNIPKVKEDINTWKDDYLAKMLKNTFRDSVSVTNDELKNYYENNNVSEKVDILEILNDNLEVIETVLKELEAGKDFRTLAGEYTQRSWTKKNGGEFGYFPVNSFGEIGILASKMKLNHVYGPIQTDSGYSIIKLIGKKIDSSKTDVGFDSVKTQLKYELLGKKVDDKFFKYIANIADKYQISINEENLKNLKVTDIPMFTYRYIGFGGRITAVPYLPPWYDWVKYLKDKSKVVP